MEQSIGRESEPTTKAGGPDTRDRDTDLRRRVRDVPPYLGDTGTALSEPDAERRRPIDPLDPHGPSRETDDPLDPVI